MNNEEAQKVLDEMQDVRPEKLKLKGEAKRLFEAIMKIAEKRDKYKEELETSIIPSYEETIKELENQLFEQQENKDKIIDLMSEQLAGLAIFDIDKKEPIILGNKEEVKQYFTQKSEQWHKKEVIIW